MQSNPQLSPGKKLFPQIGRSKDIVLVASIRPKWIVWGVEIRPFVHRKSSVPKYLFSDIKRCPFDKVELQNVSNVVCSMQSKSEFVAATQARETFFNVAAELLAARGKVVRLDPAACHALVSAISLQFLDERAALLLVMTCRNAIIICAGIVAPEQHLGRDTAMHIGERLARTARYHIAVLKTKGL